MKKVFKAVSIFAWQKLCLAFFPFSSFGDESLTGTQTPLMDLMEVYIP
jgi:hypothetical protein